ncbi:hypothetical protein [Flavivirga spongiicola]|uniref:Uncharacterized protein n=1 Tax=Flavivirga spongiicola TaxID=421621 RepID=A0ABU7XXA6_9FLAO|nr:hypothetical protein [Flavivirga sp. MEBiC05379]MDO5980423.1 hypothetical protein [Flavivirga sp. MEBiC05379]
MKQLKKLFLLMILVVLASCQNETLTEASSLEENEAAMEEEILVSDGEEDETFVLNDESENLVTPKLTFSKFSNSSKSGSTDCIPDIEGLEESLPDVVSARTTAKPGNEAYFDLEILDTNLAGSDIPAWCIEILLDLDIEGPLDFAVYSSLGDLPEGKFLHPENFDLVNWILNQPFIGAESPGGGTYTYGHVQWAIWKLTDDFICNNCSNLTNPIRQWKDDEDNNIRKGTEILEAAQANGEGFTPQCGQKLGIILSPEGKQSIIITKEVPPLEEECSDCEGKVSELELEFDWYRSKRVKIYQKKENTCYGVKVFDKVLEPGEKFTINGANSDGTFGKYIYIYIGNRCYYYTKIKTNCYTKIGPGYTRGVFNVVSGRSTQGGELCEYVKPDYNCYRHWGCKYYSKCRYGWHY